MAASMEGMKRTLWRFAKNAIFRRQSYLVSSARHCSSSQNEKAQQDPLPVFLSQEVQQILRQITGLDITKVFAPRPAHLRKPSYKFLTDKELKQAEDDAVEKAKDKLQMPPFMKPRNTDVQVLSQDPELEGYDQVKIVGVDITFGMPDQKRLIVVREPDGTLRNAVPDERDRINQAYNPQKGRMIIPPLMFQETYLENLLKKREYQYLLDKACIQFEPDNAEYIRVSRRTYEAIDEQHDYHVLRSTRHFGPMAFYYTWYRKIDYLLIDMVQRDLIQDGSDLIRLFSILHPDTQTALQLPSLHQPLDIIKMYCHNDARHRGQLELAVQAHEESTKMTDSDSVQL